MAEDCISRYRPVLPVGGLYLNDGLIMMVETLKLGGNEVDYLINNNRQLINKSTNNKCSNVVFFSEIELGS